MAEAAGTGTPGANQNGPTSTPPGSPGEVLMVGQGLALNAPAPKVDIDLQLLYVQRAFDLATRAPLRSKLIFDQFASVRPTRLTQNGAPVRMFFGEDIPEDTAGPDGGPTPLLENIDVDSVAFSGRAVDLIAREYGRTVSRTRLLNARAMVNVDPMIADRVGFDAGRAVDTLSRIALLKTSVNYVLPDGSTKVGSVGTIPAAGAGDTWLGTTSLQVAIAMLETANVMPFRGEQYVLLTSPTGAQHLKNERDTGGFRYVTARNEGEAGNSIYRGTVGMIEGADVVVSTRMPAGKSLLIGKDALAKVYSTSEGYGQNPQSIASPVTDKLRRFMHWGWLHYVGYSLFDCRSVVQISHATKFRPAGAENVGAAPGDPVVAVW